MPSLVLAILVDAMKPEYLRHAPYLRQLAHSGATGRLREDFGFVPRAAYFGGLDAAGYGFTNMYARDPERSPFRGAAVMPRLGPSLESSTGLRAHLEARARAQLPAFAASYATTAAIPFDVLARFDIVEKVAPWEVGCDYDSVFTRLRERGEEWYTLAWPETNRRPDHSDAGLVSAALGEVHADHRLALVHLQQLDALGHAFGPGSAQVRDGIVRTDRLVEQLVETLRRRLPSVDVVLFGDHGMVPVTRHLDIRPLLARSGLHVPGDYDVFLDSTMARFWFMHQGARQVMTRVLECVDGGHLLQASELTAHGLDRCDPRNGEAYFLADPGVLLFPNFFQSEHPPVGMHGYAPDCPDNEGLLLVSASEPGWQQADLGVVHAAQIFPILSKLLGLPEGPSRVTPAPVAVQAARFTACGDPEAEAVIGAQLQRIVDVVRASVPEPEAVLLEGSFGRGEGSVRRDDSGQWWPVNDYDVVVVGRGDSDRLRSREMALAAELGIDFVHFALDDGRWHELPVTMATYDRRHGSRLLFGSPAILDRLPAFAAGDIPLLDGLQLLLNRTAGLLSTLLDAVPQRSVGASSRAQYERTQIAKALVAVGDWHLTRWRGYDASCRTRLERFRWLAPGAGVTPATIDAVVSGYGAKLDVPDTRVPSLRQVASIMLPTIHDAIVATTGATTATLADAVQALVRATTGEQALVTADNERLRSPLSRVDEVRSVDGGTSLRQQVYAALPLLLDSWVRHDDEAADAWAYLDATFDSRLPRDREHALSLGIRAWFAIAL